MKILCVLLPHFPWRCEVRRHPDTEGRAAIVTHTEGSQKLVLDHSPGMEGLVRDMPLQQALARHGEAELLHADIPYYRAVFNEILDALEQKSPLVEGAEAGCIYIGADGLQLIYPGVKALSCDVLPVPVKSRNKLRDSGLATLGQIAALQPGPFQSQFGPEGKRIWELSRGQDATPLYPRFLEETIEESATLPSVTVSLAAILVAVEALLARIFAGNALKGRGIRKLTLWTRSWNAENWERSINFKEPAMDVRGT